MRSAVPYGRCAGITGSRPRQPVSVVTAALPDQRGGQWSVAGSADSSPLPGPVATSQALAPGLQLDAIGTLRATGLEFGEPNDCTLTGFLARCDRWNRGSG
ncbi:unnamed protein product [Boreogadus saida]